MSQAPPLKTLGSLVLVLAVLVGLSLVSARLWGGKSEELPDFSKLAISPEMTVAQFGQKNNLPRRVLKGLFGLTSPAGLQKKLKDFGPMPALKARLTKKLALGAEHASKNWFKIPLKFGLWFAFLAGVFFYLRKRKLSPNLRRGLLLASALIFGAIMGSDPAPMGTVKDAIHLYGSSGAVYPPRMIALAVFLLLVFFANKYICAWGCQAGTLQDFIFRLNQDAKGRAVIGRQIKPSFAVSNTVRVAFFIVFTGAALAWGMDLIAPVDPFKLYKPAVLGAVGMGFIALLCIAGLFIYRPWCHFLCPFGLVGWLVEKFSLAKIKVDYNACIACKKCAAACPSTVMGAILERNRVIPDCFSCYTCREACPTGAISFATGKRTLPPPGHFDKKPAKQGNEAVQAD